MRALGWVAAIAGGIAVVLVVTAFVGNRDKSGETVAASAWAQSVCGAVGTWRGEMKAIVADVRSAQAKGGTTEEPQSQTKQSGNSRVRQGIERGVRATDTMVTAIDNAGTPDTAQGEQASKDVSEWANSSVSSLEQAQDQLDQKPETVEQALEQLGGAVKAIVTTLTSGVTTLADVARLDPELTAAFRDSSTCQQLREKEQSS